MYTRYQIQKKTIIIYFPISKLNQTIVLIPQKDKTYKFTSKNDVFNLYTFEAPELVSFGVFIDISLSEISENKTTIEIEIRRKIGVLDKSHELIMQILNISKILELINLCVTLRDEKIESLTKITSTNQIQMNGFITKEENTKNYNCGVCKNVFYADNKQSTTWVCPHCKTPNLLPKEQISTKVLVIFALVSLTFLGLVLYFLKYIEAAA